MANIPANQIKLDLPAIPPSIEGRNGPYYIRKVPQGRKVDRVGVIPDKIVPLTLGDLKVQRDTILEEAVKTLESLRKPQDGKK